MRCSSVWCLSRFRNFLSRKSRPLDVADQIGLEKGASEELGLFVKSNKVVSRVDRWLIKFADVTAGVEVVSRCSMRGVPLMLYGIGYPFSCTMQKQFWNLTYLMACDLGPTVAKFFQWVSTRKDLVCDSVLEEFVKFQSNIGPAQLPYSLYSIIRAMPAGPCHCILNPKPVGSGCVAQVYEGFLPQRWSDEGNLDRVAIKVLRPGIRRRIELDLSIMRVLSHVLEASMNRMVKYSFPIRESIEQFATLATRQTDLRLEAQNMKQFRKNFQSIWSKILLFGTGGKVVVPRVLSQLSSRNVLVETYEDGGNFHLWMTHPENLKLQTLRSRVARFGAAVFFQMLLWDNFFHGDLHQGNIFIRVRKPYANKRWGVTTSIIRAATAYPIAKWFGLRTPPYHLFELVIIDGGLSSSFRPRDRINLLDLIRVMTVGDGYSAGRLLVERSRSQHCKDKTAFCEEVQAIVAKFMNSNRQGWRSHICHQAPTSLKLKNLHFTEVFRGILRLCMQYEVDLDPTFVRFVLAAGVLEGVGKSLDDSVDLLKAARPFAFGLVSDF